MVTKVIVSGGYADEPNKANSAFFTEILKDTKAELSILLVLFSKPQDKWSEASNTVIQQFNRIKGSKDLDFTIANHQELEKQIVKADIIYIRGGFTDKLIEAMAGHPKFVNLIKGRIVAGESAGTYLLSAHFYSDSIGEVSRGLGVIPVKSICHYKGKNQELLDEYPEDLETLLLKDFEHKVYYV